MLIALALALACAAGSPATSPTATPTTSTGTVTSTGTATSTGTTTPTTTATTTSATVGPPVEAATASLHPDILTVPVIRWTQLVEATVWVEYAFDGGPWERTPARAVPVGPAEALVLGVPPDTEVQWKVVAEAGGEASATDPATVRTEGLPADLLVPTLTAWEPSLADPSRYMLVNVTLGEWPDVVSWQLVVDRQGRVVWYTRAEGFSIWPQLALDGTHFLWDDQTWDRQVIKRQGLNGVVFEEVEAPELHHPFLEMADGTFLYGRTDGRSESLTRIEVDGSLTEVWHCDDFMVDNEMNPVWCSSNSLWYDEARDAVLFSFYSLNSVLDIDLATGWHTRWFGQVKNSYTFDPEESTFDFQHGAHLTHDGQLLVSSAEAIHNSSETEARAYLIHDDTRSLELTWSYGDGEGNYANIVGDARWLPNGNGLFNYGSLLVVREATREGQLVWELDWGTQGILGRQFLVDDLYALQGPPAGR